MMGSDDCYEEESKEWRTARGGSKSTSRHATNSTELFYDPPSHHYHSIGFRIICNGEKK